MSWVRYDDGFYSHPKVGGVIHDDPGALSLHVLANTWSCQQKRPGFIPTHQPAILVGNKTRGARWAALLEKHGLWDRVDGGWEFHDHRDYRESSKRSTPGTPAELSAKRAAAGRRGGKAAQQAKQNAKQTVQQNEQVAAEATASADSPVVASNEATPVPVTEPTVLPASADFQSIGQRSRLLTNAYKQAEPMCKWPAVNGIVKQAIEANRWSDDEIGAALLRLAAEGRSVTVDSLRTELRGFTPRQQPNRAQQRTQHSLALVDQARALDQAQQRGEIA